MNRLEEQIEEKDIRISGLNQKVKRAQDPVSSRDNAVEHAQKQLEDFEEDLKKT